MCEFRPPRRGFRLAAFLPSTDRMLTNDMRRAVKWSTTASVLMVLVGLLAILLPAVSGLAATIVVGVLLLCSGALHIALAWRGAHRGAIVGEFLLGLVYGVIGLVLLANPIAGLESLTLAISIYLAVKGVLELFLAGWIRRANGAGWLFVDAAVTLALALMIAASWPSAAAWVVGTFVGINILFSGLARLMVIRAVPVIVQ
jgi:uncharacterized membrane protein HdeD (DUF308 family)